ncbi:MAG TPA: hypothetical protein VLZ07_10075 [Syntrophales bacterium]|nr:hypothetical protein [Syntrophales bacterium]
MKIWQVKAIAKKWDIDTMVGRSKQEIIRDIQVAEGYSPCFRTTDWCEERCLWKEDCIDQGMSSIAAQDKRVKGRSQKYV